MKLENHLIYLDITQICEIGCEFCMYSDKHMVRDHLVLTDKAKQNISNLINHKSKLITHNSCVSSHLSTSIAAIQPEPAAVTA